MDEAIARAFWAAAGAAARAPAVTARVVSQVHDAARDLDGIDVDLVDLAAAIGRRVADRRASGTPDEDLAAAVDTVPAAELALARACARGDAKAIERFERSHFSAIAPALRKLGIEDARHGDVVSIVREKLFVAAPDRPPRVADLAGRGDLTALVRMVAIRSALNLRRQRQPEPADPTTTLATIVAAQTDPELASLKADQKEAFRGAFERAIAELEPEQRNLLRLSLLHGLTIDEIAAVHHIHRSTAARRVAKVRDQLGTRVRHALRRELGADRAQLESLFRVVQSSLDISFDRLLLAAS